MVEVRDVELVTLHNRTSLTVGMTADEAYQAIGRDSVAGAHIQMRKTTDREGDALLIVYAQAIETRRAYVFSNA
ncbi:hypothetical protein [Streptomyces cinereoruber]|uniref:hypothetical protein n=1 Tax=Streptomyces cinereoruber TaxID=67260 RepID=UPI003C2DBFCD